jgi:hypothetical protein
MLRLARLAALVLVAALFYTVPAHAQATRTWVSGVGDDVNPCSRTAPCKTFAGAISKTAAGGEIDCLDPGGFGAVTITKSMTIDCTGTLGSILSSSTTGILVNGAGADVIIRGLTINGGRTATPGLFGIRFLQGHSLTVEQSIIQNHIAGSPNGIGIAFFPTTAAVLNVTDTTIVGNGTAAAGGGIRVAPTGAGGSAVVALTNTRVFNNANNALAIDVTGNTGGGGVNAVIVDSIFSGSSNGITMIAPAAVGVNVTITGTTVSHNTTGIATSGPSAFARVGHSTITLNGTGVSPGTGTLNTYGDNYAQGNGVNGSFTGLPIPKT